MPTLPDNPDLDQLRHQARDLWRAARAGDREAAERIGAVSDQVTLAAAQLVIARHYGFAGWPALKAEVEARSRTLAEAVDAFLVASVNGRLGRAGQLWGRHPGIAGYDVRTAVALGDAARVGAALDRDPELVGRRDPRTGWTALHLACASRWHTDPARADGLVTIVGLLLDAGADPVSPPDAESQWSPLRCAVASAASGRGNEPIVRLLLDRGATVADEDLYLAGFAGGGSWCVRLLLEYTPNVPVVAAKALAAPISLGDTDGVRALLDAGADPLRYRDDDGRPAGVVLSALRAGCGVELIESLLAHGADPNEADENGRSVGATAMAGGRAELVDLLHRHGARDDSTPLDRLRYACLRGDRAGALRLCGEHPTLRAQLADSSALITAAEAGDTPAVELLLEIGFPVAVPGRFDRTGTEVTALHAAAWAGSAEATKRLLAAGAPVDAADGNWQSTPLQWALIGSSERRATNPSPDWVQTVRVLLDAGAATDRVDIGATEPHPPDPEIVELLGQR
ncbi:MAG TPA: ankyrin repeat domain-containing protein [Pseudonocardiaceae bacterium]|nr:ankyrin repeat domain-containing protein [Pseudonocardiaceae bacterium]